ncbi:MAG: TetR family transcriptional regulator [Halioglobus sp.]|nr:TetR family transcriptional regulator [Halioglobus sp.]
MEATQTKLLDIAVELFADQGFSGVSMRGIARAAGITQAAIYHHFANKEALYFAALEHVYAGQAMELVSQASQEPDPRARLAVAVRRLLEVFDEDSRFRRLYLRELLEGDQARLKLLAEGVFGDLHQFLLTLMAELAPQGDAHLLVLDLSGMIVHHLEARQLSSLLSSGRPQHQELPYLAEHITALLLNGVRSP